VISQKTFTISLDSLESKRTIYSILNWLGDVGGLSGMIFCIASYLNHWKSELQLESFVASSIFKSQGLRLSSKICCQKKNVSDKRKLGFLRASSEVDFVHFVRQQQLVRSLLKLLTS